MPNLTRDGTRESSFVRVLDNILVPLQQRELKNELCPTFLVKRVNQMMLFLVLDESSHTFFMTNRF